MKYFKINLSIDSCLFHFIIKLSHEKLNSFSTLSFQVVSKVHCKLLSEKQQVSQRKLLQQDFSNISFSPFVRFNFQLMRSSFNNDSKYFHPFTFQSFSRNFQLENVQIILKKFWRNFSTASENNRFSRNLTFNRSVGEVESFRVQLDCLYRETNKKTNEANISKHLLSLVANRIESFAEISQIFLKFKAESYSYSLHFATAFKFIRKFLIFLFISRKEGAITSRNISFVFERNGRKDCSDFMKFISSLRTEITEWSDEKLARRGLKINWI